MNNNRKINEAKHILNMLGVNEINPDEVNARVWALEHLQGDFNISFSEDGTIYYRHNDWTDSVPTILSHKFDHTKYLTSLDACQSLMLEGWQITIHQHNASSFTAIIDKDDKFIMSDELAKTMPIAWLHAILQSYIYTWEQEDENNYRSA